MPPLIHFMKFFNSVEISDNDTLESLSKFIDELSINKPYDVIAIALTYAQAQGIFTLTESEIISKSLRSIDILRKKEK